MSETGSFGRGDLTLILIGALAVREMYGYELAGELRRRSDGVFDLPEGTIYPALRRLERRGLVRGRWADADGAPRRRYYALTQSGQHLLASGREEWRKLVAATDALLGG